MRENYNTDASLTIKDYEGLERCFIPPEIVEKARIERVDSSRGAEIVGRTARNGTDYAGLIFPYYWPGDPNPREYRLRRDHPDLESNENGIKEKNKYLSPPGRGNLPYFPPDTPPEYLTDSSIEIYITEGEKKALALYQFNQSRGSNALVIGLSGVWNWRGTVGKVADDVGHKRPVKGVIPDFDRIAWADRKVTIIFDANVKTNDSVQAAQRMLTKELVRRKAAVYHVDLPDIERVNGVDDLLALKGPDFLATLIEQSVKADPDPISTLSLDAELTEQGNAEAIIRQYGDVIRYVPSNREFMAWDGKRWTNRGRAYMSNLAVKTAKEYLTKAGQAGTPVDESIKYAKHGKRSLSSAAIKAVVSLCENFEEIHVEADLFNPDPHLLNVANGIIDLRTGELLPHDASRMIRSFIPIEYDPAASCPIWEESIRQIFNYRDDLIQYVQRYAGYTATGETKDQSFLILYGSGANGKSKMIEALSNVMGDYHKATRAETLMIKRGDNIPNDVADLWGARFISAIETEAGTRMAQSLVKSLSGGDKIKARFLFKEYFEFMPTFKLWLAVNHKPIIDGSDEAMIRRIRLIPFDVKFEDPADNPETKFPRDNDLPKKWEAEYPGILRWIVEGAICYYRDGLKTPDAVKAATRAYASEMDSIKAFIDSECVLGYDYNIRKTQLVEAYTTFCAENNETPIKGKALHDRLIRMGFTDGRTNKDRFWKGLALNVRNSEE